ncbi:MAG: Crp/Fnr family transcriptional regulator [Chloroflexi bacterium]|nr:MAG: Crp/Fnr family transcriptional regulator [Chloroflexota bacterium]
MFSASDENGALLRRVRLLKGVPLFADLAEDELATLVSDFRLREYARDEIIFHQGDVSREVYIVVKGKVRIFRICPAGSETSINIFSTHDVIGEFAAIDGKPRSATAKAIGPTTLLQMVQDRFLYHMQSSPGLAMAMCKLLVQKLRWTASYAETIAQYDAAGRLLHILLLYNEQLGQKVGENGRFELNLDLNQTDLASLVGARREWINRILADWRKRGLIEFDSGKITILDLDRVMAERDSRIEAHLERW